MFGLSAAPKAALGNPRFSQSFLHGETTVSPTPFACKWLECHCRSQDGKLLLFSLFVFSLSSAPFAELLELDLFDDKLLILARPIIGAIALGAGKFYELILGHAVALYVI